MNDELFYAAAYIRLSREDGDKEESYSVSNQKQLLSDYISNKENFLLYDYYIDDGYTGTNFNRPGFNRLISDIEKGEVNCVVVKDLSRFGRDYIETGRYLERYFPKKSVRFISIADNIDSDKKSYDMLLPIKNIFNEQYARDISLKIHTTVKSKQKAGEFIGAFATYGYKKSPSNKNKLIIDDYAAEIVRRIFQLFISGYNRTQIARILNQEGVLCPTDYKKANGEHYVNHNRLSSTSYWTQSTIAKMLKNEMYIGNMVQGKRQQEMHRNKRYKPCEEWIVVEGTHEPIVSKETFETAQRIINMRTRDMSCVKNINKFAGFLRCGDCGRALSKTYWKNKKKPNTYKFVCGTYKRIGMKYCTPHSISESDLEKLVLDDLNAIIVSVTNLCEMVSSVQDHSTRDAYSNESDKLKKELEKIKHLKKSSYEDYKEGLITKEEFISFRADYQTREDNILKKIEMCEEKEKEVSDIFDIPWIKRLVELKHIDQLDRSILVEMLSVIKIYEDRIQIVYNFSNDLNIIFPESAQM